MLIVWTMAICGKWLKLGDETHEKNLDRLHQHHFSRHQHHASAMFGMTLTEGTTEKKMLFLFFGVQSLQLLLLILLLPLLPGVGHGLCRWNCCWCWWCIAGRLRRAASAIFELENRLTRVSQKIDLIYFIHQAIPVHVQVTSNLRQRCLGAKGAIVSTGY